MLDDLTTALVTEHRRDLDRLAAADRLARIAQCCKPSALRQRMQATAHWLRAGQLGTGRFEQSTAPLTSRGCCA
jgi:hypothetical protein